MKRYLAASLLVLLLTSAALACDSYESCMELSREPNSGSFDVQSAQIHQTRAIAYKLDTIDKQNQTLITNLTLALIKTTDKLADIEKKLDKLDYNGGHKQ